MLLKTGRMKVDPTILLKTKGDFPKARDNPTMSMKIKQISGEHRNFAEKLRVRSGRMEPLGPCNRRSQDACYRRIFHGF
jgi:hypothetical protein